MGVIPLTSLVGVQALYPHPRQEHRLGSVCRSAGGQQAVRNPRYTPCKGEGEKCGGKAPLMRVPAGTHSLDIARHIPFIAA
jgi:hypothetical protein